jgi:hypothetical protein
LLVLKGTLEDFEGMQTSQGKPIWSLSTCVSLMRRHAVEFETIENAIIRFGIFGPLRFGCSFIVFPIITAFQFHFKDSKGIYQTVRQFAATRIDEKGTYCSQSDENQIVDDLWNCWI